MSDELALPPVSDMRTNEEIARAIWREQISEFSQNDTIRRAFMAMPSRVAAAFEAEQLSILMAALANIRGIGTA